MNYLYWVYNPSKADKYRITREPAVGDKILHVSRLNIDVEITDEFSRLVINLLNEGLKMGKSFFEPEQEDLKREELLATPIEDLDISVLLFNCLRAAKIDTIGKIIQRRPDELLKIRNLGSSSLHELEKLLSKHGLKLKEKLK